MVRQSKKNDIDIVIMQCILGKDGNIKVSLKDKMEVWKKYEEKLRSDEIKWSRELNVEKNEGP